MQRDYSIGTADLFHPINPQKAAGCRKGFGNSRFNEMARDLLSIRREYQEKSRNKKQSLYYSLGKNANKRKIEPTLVRFRFNVLSFQASVD